MNASMGMLKRAVGDLHKLLAERGVEGFTVYQMQGSWNIYVSLISEDDMKRVPTEYMGFSVKADFQILSHHTKNKVSPKEDKCFCGREKLVGSVLCDVHMAEYD